MRTTESILSLGTFQSKYREAMVFYMPLLCKLGVLANSAFGFHEKIGILIVPTFYTNGKAQ